MPNYNITTGIPFGVISFNSLDPDFLDELYRLPNPSQDQEFADYARQLLLDKVTTGELTEDDLDLPTAGGPGKGELGCEDARLDALQDHIVELTNEQVTDLLESVDPGAAQDWLDGCESTLVGVEGEIEGVSIAVSELGGAGLLWVFESPFTTRCRPGSVCIPGAGDLDSLDPDGVEAYDVPKSWRYSEA